MQASALFPLNYFRVFKLETFFILFPKNPCVEKQLLQLEVNLQSAFQCAVWGHCRTKLSGKTLIQQNSPENHNLISMADIKYVKNSLKIVSIYFWWAGIPDCM